MTNTQTKFEEAQYFLKQMESNITNFSNFKFNMSAFVSAARSVTLCMQKEYSKEKGFPNWYENKQKEMNKNPIFEVFNKKRVITIHLTPIKTRKDTLAKLTDTITLSDRLVTTVIHANGSIEMHDSGFDKKSSPKYKKAEIKHLWFFEDYPKKDIISLSQEYLSLLGDIVEECNSKFKLS